MRMTGTREGAIDRAEKYFDTGGFLADLQRRVAIPTTSQEQGSMPALQEYVSGEMSGSLKKLGYECTVLPNPRAEYGPFLIARRVEDPAKPTVLTYGHGDVIRGQDDQWRQGLSPWKIVIEGEKMYGRGTADNKGQHTINIAALECVSLVSWFDEDTPLSLILATRPDVLVKGGDWKPEAMVGSTEVRGWGGSVHSIPFLVDTSTTRTLTVDIARARSLDSAVIWLALTPGAGRISKTISFPT